MIVELFFLIGAIIFIGFFSLELFKITKIPDVLILMLLGVLLGPLTGIAKPSFFAPYASYIATLALIIILFEGGLNLNFFKVLTELSKTFLFTLLAFTLTAIFVAIFSLVFEWDLIAGLLLGATLGGSSSAIVLGIVDKLDIKPDTKILLSLESAFTDALCVIIAITIMDVMLSSSVSVFTVSHSILSAFSIAAFIAAVFAFFWVGVLGKFHGKSFGYMLTLAVIFIMYSLVESVKGSGAIAVLTFGLLLGNFSQIANLIKLKGDFTLQPSIKQFQKEVTFFVRTFFFVYLGVIINLSTLTTIIIIISAAALVAIAIARIISVKVLTLFDKSLARYAPLIVAIAPRGLAAAVLASMPATLGINIPGFEEIVFIVIILTNLIATIGVFAFERFKSPEPPEKKPGGK